ncbi:MAG: PAS domain S-box protein [Sedimentisphaerales bacterium]|nr:PAS domain S-box protein [Sedimentisphaerales bacterium]
MSKKKARPELDSHQFPLQKKNKLDRIIPRNRTNPDAKPKVLPYGIEDNWENTFNAISDWITITDLECRVIRTNLSGEKFTNLTSAEILGQSCCMLIHGKTKPIPECPLMEMLRTGRRSQAEVLLPNNRRWMSITVDPVRDEHGKTVAAVHVVRDITSQKTAENAVRISEEKFRNIFTHANDCITYLDGFGRIVDVNEKTLQIFGGTREELLNKHFTKLGILSVKDVPKYLRLFKSILAGEQVNITVPIKNKVGREIFLECSASVIKPNGDSTRILVIARDITERRKSEKELRIKDKAIETSINAIAITDLNGILRYVNLAFLKMWGYDNPDEVLGKSAKHFWEMPKELKNSIKTFRRGGGWITEVPAQRKDCSMFIVQLSASVVLDKDGKADCIMTSFIDITERIKVEKNLLAERDKAQKYLDISGVMIVAVDTEGRVGLINKKGCEILGYSEDEILGKNWFENFLPGRIRKSVRIKLDNVIKGRLEQDDYAENYVLTKTGQERIIGWHNTLLKDADGCVIGTLSSGEDITERKLAENALRKSEEHYRMLAESMNDGLSMTDENGIKIYVNKRCAEIFGYDPDQMLGKHWMSFYDEDTRHIIEEQWNKRKKGVAEPYEILTRGENGREIYLRISPRPIFDENGNFRGSISIIADITERKEIENALRQSEEKFYKAFQTSPNLMAITTVEDGRIDEINETFCRVLGYSRQECIGRTTADLNLWQEPEQRTMIIREVRAKGCIDNVEAGLRTKGGRIRNLIFSMSTITLGDEKYLLSVATDITERKLVEEKLLKSEAILNETGSIAQIGGWEHDLVTGKATWTKGLYEIDELESGSPPGPNEHLEQYPPRDRAILAEAYERAVETGEPFDLELQVYTAKRHLIWCRVIGRPVMQNGKCIRLLGTVQNISNRKQAEVKYQTILDTTIDGFAITDLKGNILEVNDSYCRMVAYSREDLLQMSVEDIEVIESSRDILRHIKEMKKHGSGRFETRHKCKDGRIIDVEVSVNYLDEGQGRLFIFVRNITERKLAEKALRESEELFRTFIEQASEAVFVHDLNGDVLIANEMACKYTGYSRKELSNINVARIDASIIEEDHKNRYWEKLRIGEHALIETINKRKDSSNFPVEVQIGKIIFDGKPMILAFARDITERKRAEEALRDSELKFRLVTETIEDVFWMSTCGVGKMIYISPAYERLWQKSIESLYKNPKSFLEILHPEDLRDYLVEIDRYHKNGLPYECEYRIIREDGEIKWIHERGYPVPQSLDDAPLMAGVCTDITERKKAEQALREKQNQLLEAQHIAHISNWWHDLITGELYWSDEIFRIIGIEPQKPTAELVAALVHPDDWHILQQAMDEAMVGKAEHEHEFRIIRPDGGIRWIHNRWVSFYDETGKEIKRIGTHQDISERKKAEEALIKERDFEESLIETAQAIILVLDADGKIVRFNKYMEEISGYSLKEVQGKKWFDIFLPKCDKNRIRLLFRKSINNIRTKGNINSIVTKRGEELQIEWYDKTLKDTTGKVIGLLSVGLDITQKIIQAQALEESEKRLQMSLDAAELGIWDWDLINNKIIWAGYHAKLFGYKEDEFDGKYETFEKRIHPDDLRCLIEAIEKSQTTGQEYLHEYRIVWPDGTLRWIFGRGRCIYGQNGKGIRMLGTVQDITERKQTEDEVHRQRRELQTILDSVPAGIWYKDSTNRFLKVNKAAAESVCMRPEEIEGKLAGDIFPRDDAEKYYRDDLEIIKSGKPKWDIIEMHQVPGGERKWVHTDKVPCLDKHGNATGVIVFVLDINDQIRAEQNLLEYHKKLKFLASQLTLTEEHERRRIATELHDHIGQFLAVSKIKIDELLHSDIPEESREILKNVRDWLGKAVKDTRTLTFDLSFPILYELGFEQAVAAWLDEEIRRKHKIETELQVEANLKLLDDDIKVLLFRNVKELLINVVKHAHAKKVIVSIGKVDGMVKVIVEDDGIGFDLSKVSSSRNAAFGLFSIRERLEHLGGEFHVDSSSGRGCKVTLLTPIIKDKHETGGKK